MDVERSNAALARLPGIIRALRAAGTERRTLELLDDESEHVRAWAGFDALHSAIGYVTPMDKMNGWETQIWEERDQKLEAARERRRQRRIELRQTA